MLCCCFFLGLRGTKAFQNGVQGLYFKSNLESEPVKIFGLVSKHNRIFRHFPWTKIIRLRTFCHYSSSLAFINMDQSQISRVDSSYDVFDKITIILLYNFQSFYLKVKPAKNWKARFWYQMLYLQFPVARALLLAAIKQRGLPMVCGTYLKQFWFRRYLIWST